MPPVTGGLERAPELSVFPLARPVIGPPLEGPRCTMPRTWLASEEKLEARPVGVATPLEKKRPPLAVVGRKLEGLPTRLPRLASLGTTGGVPCTMLALRNIPSLIGAPRDTRPFAKS